MFRMKTLTAEAPPTRRRAHSKTGEHCCSLLLLLALIGSSFTLLAQDLPPPTDAPAPGSLPPTEQSLTLNFKDADIRTLISAVSELTGRNFIVDPRVRGTVTVISAAATDPDQLYDVFLSILRVHGFSAVDGDGMTRIVPAPTALQTSPAVGTTSAATHSEDIVTAVFPLRNMSAAELVPVLRPLLPQEAHMAATVQNNILVVVDTAGNIERLRKVIESVDIQPSEGIELVRIQHATAREIVEILEALATKKAGTQGGQADSAFVVDERSNSVLISGRFESKLRYRALIAQLDQPRTEDEIKVVNLRFANAEDLVPVLQEIVNGQSTTIAGGGGNKGGAKIASTPMLGGGSNGSSTVRITADEAINAVILQAPQQDMRSVMSVIRQLDVRRAQVLVQGIVAEVSEKKSAELGVQWKTSLPNSGVVAGTLLPGTNAGGIDSPFDVEDAIDFGQGLTLGMLSGGDLRALVRALAGDAFTNVLSTPSLMTLDNAEAEIVVGQNVPFVTGQFTNQTTTPDQPFQTIQRQDVGILLKVKPQINEGNTVTMEIKQEVSSIDQSTRGADLITNKRAITTSVVVDDGDVVVLGGLIGDDARTNVQKVPLLGDIPLLGNLFRNTNNDSNRTNLMVFLRPQVVRDKATAIALSQEKMSAIQRKQAEQEQAQKGILLRQPGARISNQGIVE